MATCSINENLILDNESVANRFISALEKYKECETAMNELENAVMQLSDAFRYKVAHNIFDLCLNRKVVHLAKYGRTKRIRKKNQNRIIRNLVVVNTKN